MLLVCKSPPDELAVREWTDMALMTAMFQQHPTLLLLGPGVRNLWGNSPLTDLAGLLPEPCRVDMAALPDGAPAGEPVLEYQGLDAEGIRQLYAQARQVITL